MSAPEAFLLDLFREEMAQHSAVLTDGLLALERTGAAPERIEPLMRAAHSIKGAARVVELAPIVKVAHAMEEVLIAAGSGRLNLDATAIDQLLAALDWMVAGSTAAEADWADWLALNAAVAEDWCARLKALAAVAPPPVAAPPPEAAPEPVSALPPASPAASRESAPRGDEAVAAGVRISAETLGQLLAQAAELLLETRRIEALGRDFQALKRLQRRLSDLAVGGAGPADDEPWRRSLSELGSLVDGFDRRLGALSRRSSCLAERLHDLALRARLRPFGEGTQGFPRMVRDLARQLGKEVDFTLAGTATLVDRDILARLEAPLNHLLRNALDHGLEAPGERLAAGKPVAGRLRLEAHHHGGRLLVSVSDDGRGIDREGLRRRIIAGRLVTPAIAERLSDAELFSFLFLPGLSTRTEADEISGRGIGLDVVQTMVHECGGSLEVRSEHGRGTRFDLRLPVTRSVLRTLLVVIAEQCYALPLARIDRVERRSSGELEAVDGQYHLAGERGRVALVPARRLLGLEDAPVPAEWLELVLFSVDGRHYALEVDGLLGESELVVRPLDERLGKVPNFAALAFDGNGEPVLILDPDDLARAADRLAAAPQPLRRSAAEAPSSRRLLVVDDSITVREVERKLLENAGYAVDVAVDGVDAWNQLRSRRYDLVVSDVDMPRLNGIDLVRRIRGDSRLRLLPVIIVSYKDRAEDRERGLEAGADHYLTKSSFHDSGLIQAVRDLIGDPDAP